MRKIDLKELLIFIGCFTTALGNIVIMAGQKPYSIKSHHLKIEFNSEIHEMRVIDKISLSENLNNSSPFVAKIDSLFSVSKIYTLEGKVIAYTYQDGRLIIPNLTGVKGFNVEYSGILNTDLRSDPFAKVAGSFYLLKELEWIFTPAGTRAEKAVTEYHINKELDIVTEGRQVGEKVIGDKKISTWEVDGCESWLYFMIGKWEKTSSKVAQSDIRVWLASRKPELAEKLIGKIEKIIRYYSEIYTVYPRPSFTYLEFPNDYAAWNGYLKVVFMRESATWGILDDVEFMAHEIAHNWWPNYIGLKRNEELDLDAEAFCDFSAALANEFLFGSVKSQERAKDLVWLMAYPDERYRKGKLLLHNFRLIYGDQSFFRWIKDFSEKYKGKRTSVEDFFAIAPQKEGFDLNEFLNNWAQIKIPPILELKYEKRNTKSGDRCEVMITIHQQSNPLARWYLPVLFRSKNTEVQKVVNLTGKITESFFETEFEPEEVLLDPNYIIPRRTPEFQKYAETLVLIDAKAFPLIYKKNYQDCLPFLFKALELDGENAETHYLIGRVYKNLNQPDKAKEFFSTTTTKLLGWYMGNRYTTDQLHVYSHWELAQIFLKEKNYALARKHFETILAKPDIEGYHAKALEELKKLI
jgi:hypothetical protein